MRFIPNMCNKLNAIIEAPRQKVDIEKLRKSCGKAVEKLWGKSLNKKYMQNANNIKKLIKIKNALRDILKYLD